MTWYYCGLEFKEDDIGDNLGFVYIIENLTNGKKYIGQKKFFSQRRVKQKNKKNKKRVRSMAAWELYYGSNEHLQQDVKNIGKENFKRIILRLCKTKGEMNYYELREQVLTDSLLKPEEYYNSYIGGRINRSHVKI